VCHVGAPALLAFPLFPDQAFPVSADKGSGLLADRGSVAHSGDWRAGSFGGNEPAMLSGFNTNVRHRGLLLHVQTEDSGRVHPHIITHLYHGGTILASEKSQYGDRLEASDLVAVVRGLMEEQHRAMLRRLKRGELDTQLLERLGSGAFSGDESAVAGSEGTGPTAAASAERAEVADAPPEIGSRSERPLDEVVLEYLQERARTRRRRP